MNGVTNPSVRATDPQLSMTVSASAGTGKTYLLVTRILRLLLSGSAGDSILAITFTRKAADEMRARLNQRMLELAAASPAQIEAMLNRIGVAPSEEHVQRASCLYEQALRSEHQIRATTFHAFCQDLLQRFPYEAGIEPGFELSENNAALVDEAWQLLCDEATRQPDEALALALDTLFRHCGSLSNARAALNEFIQHRSDWWAYTRGWRNATATAGERLQRQLGIDDPARDPAADFFVTETLAQLQEYHELLMRHPIKSNCDLADRLHGCLCLMPDLAHTGHLRQIAEIFLTQQGTPRKRGASKVQEKSMGSSGQQRFLELHDLLVQRLLAALERVRALATFHAGTSWYVVGNRFIEHYQLIKKERRLLDFDDLEWRAYLLLNEADSALWVQYKLDQQIEHLLVDEFQDTNPTQWRLLLPLLEEMAAAKNDRKRSVFIVGDHKQSIYGFRRAEPRLMKTAERWLQTSMSASTCSLTHSYRSAPLIIELVNGLFGAAPFRERLPGFEAHHTVHKHLWSRIELLPLVVDEGEAHGEGRQQQTPLRNPLQNPRPLATDDRYFREGLSIAERIVELVGEQLPVIDEDRVRPIRFGDFMILVRSHRHMNAYEDALRIRAVPYLGCARSSMLDHQEVADFAALLTSLVAPYDNLALATLLRSPLFECSDDDLMKLALTAKQLSLSGTVVSWHDALAHLADVPVLARARDCLARWSKLAGRLPVHDIIDRIVAETNLVQRYQSAFAPHLHGRVTTNIRRLIEFALEMDSGRYPSLPRFLARLEQHSDDQQSRSATTSEAGLENAVRVMTIHGAKGLEAPAVFIADTGFAAPAVHPYRALIEWLPDQDRPSCFLLTTKKAELDDFSGRQLNHQEQARRCEDANLLYVAVTRARQFLFVSGCASARSNDHGWYGQLRDYLLPRAKTVAKGGLRLVQGTPAPFTPDVAAPAPGIAIDARLSTPFTESAQQLEIVPSRDTKAAHTADNAGTAITDRGVVIHRMLELINRGAAVIGSKRPASMPGLEALDIDLDACWLEACALVSEPSLRAVFDPACYVRAYDEVPISYRTGARMVQGQIDRLVEYEDHLLLVDYKTHRMTKSTDIAAVATDYLEQMNHYRRGIEKLWPRRSVQCALLFTAARHLYRLGTG